MPRFIPFILDRRSWMLGGMTIRKAHNLAKVAFAYATKSEKVHALPPILKIDISPICGLQCPSCLHANPEGRSLPLLEAQRFGKTRSHECGRFHSHHRPSERPHFRSEPLLLWRSVCSPSSRRAM